MIKQNAAVDHYLQAGCGRCEYYDTPQCKVNNWREIMLKIRDVLLDTELKEELKWGVACYTFGSSNIVLLSALKDFATLNFLKGVLLKDADGLLHKPGENSQSARYMKFTDAGEVENNKEKIRAFISEAIELEKSGVKVDFSAKKELTLPDELLEIFKQNSNLENAFYALTPGRQRGYNLFFTAPKQSKTRISRIEKMIPKIMAGKGLQER